MEILQGLGRAKQGGSVSHGVHSLVWGRALNDKLYETIRCFFLLIFVTGVSCLSSCASTRHMRETRDVVEVFVKAIDLYSTRPANETLPRWQLWIRPDGSGTLQLTPRPSPLYFGRSTFDFPEVCRNLQKTAKDHGSLLSGYIVEFSFENADGEERATAQYYVSDSEVVLDLFDTVISRINMSKLALDPRLSDKVLRYIHARTTGASGLERGGRRVRPKGQPSK